jgi:glycosyltransferase involved in cell wall biosynthesis
VTWERRVEEADVLTVTNYWPDGDGPTRAPFLRSTVDGLAAAGVKTDVLYVRGYKGKHVYLLACAGMAMLPLAGPRKYRLVHSHAGETALAARFFWGAPMLATYWGTDLIGSNLGRLTGRLKFLLASRLIRQHARLMTATTTKTVEMERLLPRRVRRRNWVIPDGVDLSRFRPLDRGAARAALGWPPDAPVVINVGDRSPVKRVWLAQRVADLASREIAGLRFYAVSDAPPEDMPLYYNAADLLLHTAISEGSPNAVKEAVACDLPVVATSAGDIAQVLEGVEPSVICDAAAQSLAGEVVRILREPRRSNGQQRIPPLQLEVTTAKTLACYRSLGAPIHDLG